MSIIQAVKCFVKANTKVKPMSDRAINKYVKMSYDAEKDVFESRSTIANYLKHNKIKAEIKPMSDEFSEDVPASIENFYNGAYRVSLKDKLTGEKLTKTVLKADDMNNFDIKTEQPITRRIFKAISDGVNELKSRTLDNVVAKNEADVSAPNIDFKF